MNASAAPSVLANFLVFQVGWFACVISAAQGMPWIGALAVLAAIIFHLQRVSAPFNELIVIISAGVIGAVWDSLLVMYAGLQYDAGIVLSDAAPYWIVAMWMLFATTLNVSLRWLKHRRSLAALFGALGGPLAYWAGAKLGAVEFADLSVAMTALALGWAVLTPALVAVSNRFDGVAPMRLSMAESS